MILWISSTLSFHGMGVVERDKALTIAAMSVSE